ncbi:MFS transporter [Actinoplanes sp. L3-i22]|uniref:MFS transporter n=1 Tax=Actinoplanes sp. L3-i22 TaxID=2836373 RepID=UPI001C74DDA0|nr:MFS transporter [Actinoplanes sp. L3-i22]BCY11713.1 MFS transporter [Actinoplanes sp. L3-i22]
MLDTPAHPPLRRNRDFRLIWLGGVLAGLGSMIGNLAMPLLVLHETGSPAKAGLLGTVSAVTVLIVIIPAGSIVDATERRRLMIRCQVAGSLIAAVIAVFVLAGHPVLVLLLIATAVVSVLGSLYTPASSALLRDAVPAGQLGLAISRLQARTAALQIAGPLIGGALFSLAPALPFGVRALALLGSVVCLLLLRTRSAPGPADGSPMTLGSLTAGFRFVWGHRYLRVVLFVYGAGLTAVYSAVMLVAISASAERDPSGRSSGLLVAVVAVGSLAGALLAPRLGTPRHPRLLTVLSCWAFAAAIPVLALLTRPAAMGAVLGAAMFLSAIGNVAFETEMIRLTPSDLIGRAEAGAIFISLLAQPLGPLGGGLLVENLGSRPAFVLLGGVVAVLATLLTVFLIPRTRSI